MHGATRLERLERRRPEVQPEDVAFPGEQVVAHVQPAHRLDVTADDAVGDEGAHLGERVAACLDLVERMRAHRQPRFVCFVPLGDARVQIPAVVVEPDGRIVGKRLYGGEVARLERREPDDDVGDLDAGVVDVVLDFDLAPLKAEQPHQRVAERGIPQVADVRRLVRVDRRVLDDNLAAAGRRRGRLARAEPLAHQRVAREKQVDVAVRGFDPRDSSDRAERCRQLLADDFRRLAQPARQLEGDRQRQIAERPGRRRIDDDFLRLVGLREPVRARRGPLSRGDVRRRESAES